MPEDPGVGELDDPGFDPGGETALPFETAPVAPTVPAVGQPDQGVEEPLEVEPQDDPDARLVPPSEPSPLPTEEPAATGDEAPVPPADGVAPEASPMPSEPEPDRPPSAPAEEPPRDDVVARGVDQVNADRRETGRPEPEQRLRPDEPVAEERGEPVAEERAVQPPAAATAPVPTAAPEPEPVVVAQVNVTDRPDRSLRHRRTYIVAPGDSLWSIAKRLLGRDASAAQIAREVARLWSLNQHRIGTGDPDLLMVGTQLSLQ